MATRIVHRKPARKNAQSPARASRRQPPASPPPADTATPPAGSSPGEELRRITLFDVVLPDDRVIGESLTLPVASGFVTGWNGRPIGTDKPAALSPVRFIERPAGQLCYFVIQADRIIHRFRTLGEARAFQLGLQDDSAEIATAFVEAWPASFQGKQSSSPATVA